MLIGTAAYTSRRLTEIPHSLENVRGLDDTLTNRELCGFAARHVTRVLDPDKADDIMRPVRAAAEQAEEVLLVYYSGHGLLAGEDGDLHLSLTGSEPSEPWTSLQFSYLADAVKQSCAHVKIVILDCCYSGRALSDLMSDGSQLVEDQLNVRGLYCLASSAETKRSKALEGEEYSAFTGHLLTVIREGIPGAGPALRLDDLWSQVCRRMRSTTLPRPVRCDRDDAGAFSIVRNRAYTPTSAEPLRLGGSGKAAASTPIAPSGRPLFETVEGSGYHMGDVKARLDDVIAVVVDPSQGWRAGSPYFQTVSGRGRYGYETGQVDAYIERQRPEPAEFVDALRMILVHQGVTVVADNGPQGRRISKLKARCRIPDGERLIGYLKRNWLEASTGALAFTDTHLCVADSSSVLRVPYPELESMSLSSSSEWVRWSGSTDQGGFGGETFVVSTTVSFGHRSVEVSESDGDPIQTTLSAFLPAVAELRKRHPEWFR